MAIRNILLDGESALLKVSRPVTEFNDRLHNLLDDLKDTLKKAGGVGLAAPQVGVLRRVAIVLETNVEEGQEEYPIELVNPVIIQREGEQDGAEGCLSIPGKYGYVTRPERVVVRAQDRNGNTFEVEGHGITARCFCHELEHLDGILFTKWTDELYTADEL